MPLFAVNQCVERLPGLLNPTLLLFRLVIGECRLSH